jgi:anti-sigma-K factor RskA
MSNSNHVEELLPAYAIDALEEDETVRVSEHLAGCLACRAELTAYQAVADSLALAAPDAEPPADLKQRLMTRVQPSRPLAPARLAPQRRWWQSWASLTRKAMPAWGVISVVLVVALGIGNLVLWQRASRPLVTPSLDVMRTVALQSTDAAPDAVGTVVIDMDGDHGALVVDGLSPLDVDHQYQVWLIVDGQRTSGGVFSVDESGYGVLWLSSPQPLSDYEAVGITIEPAGGSPGPTGEKVLGGTL